MSALVEICGETAENENISLQNLRFYGMKDFIRERVCFYTSVFSDRFSEHEMLEYASSHGAAGLELFNYSEELKTPDMKAAREIGKRARQLALKIPCFSAGLDFASGNYSEKLELAKGYIDICSELEIPLFHHTLIFALSEPSDLDVAKRIGLETALLLSDYAKGRGVKTVIEDQGFVYNGLENYKYLIDASNSGIGILLDVGNTFFVDESPVDFLRGLGRKVDHVHIKDYEVSDFDALGKARYRSRAGKYISSVEIGTGEVDFPKIAEELLSFGYSGVYSIESSLSGEAEVDRVLDRLYRWFGNNN